MSRKGDLERGGKDPHLRRVVGMRGRQDKGGLGIVELGCHLLHLGRRQAFRIQDHRQRIALEGLISEDIDRDVTTHKPSDSDESGSIPAPETLR